MLVTYARQDDPRYAYRADPAYWDPAYAEALRRCRYPLRPLGDFISHITYGPIITGMAPPQAPDGIALMNQGQIGETAVDLREAVRVPAGCPWDRPSARLQSGDIVMARSGMGSLVRNRLAVYLEEEPAVVGSFVDLIRVRNTDPIYTMLYLKCEFGWLQIHRLINGVALPNISFDEIRGLQVAMAPEELQAEARARYLLEVYPLRASEPAAARAGFRGLVGWLEPALRGPRT